ncbi:MULTISPECIES: hypothetical protein [Stenotrophomonas]|jgi:hypothetical protein|uniref:hypothetical protein n=1 Tax=Stenotrophomonas TaxID=40323 RepID=UPI00201CE4BA|nr:MULTISPECIES: hypothetical protein [Stenotrophomonas]MBN5025000.1 hypothetical protein [Stenotrophomonas maltophilia]MDH1274907.1 hypothetical protein [Stenotrophomonas sp. GD03937]MDH1486430.1 hypothetical protein [Stenotrophomonas sp. GD03712]UQY95194.1 hypothetical protein LZ605_19055 [Stenotrophomonas maltophilia]WON68103.1 hypothetical protein RWT08_18115 [Stenotrophomonas maltophilia]
MKPSQPVPELLLFLSLLVAGSATAAPSAATAEEAGATWRLVERWSLQLARSDLVAQLSTLAPPGSRSEARMGRGDSATIDLAPFVIAGRINGPSGQIHTDASGRIIKGVTLSLSGACISRKQMGRRYPGFNVLSVPSGHSLDESTVFGTVVNGIQIGFSFSEHDRDCMNQLTLSWPGERF